jgi:glucose-1-phosphate thymidylyltransferase
MGTRGLILAHTVQDHETSPLDRGRMRHMLPVANKPILFHALESMAAAGIEDVAVAVTADAEERITDAVGSGGEWGLRVHYLRAERTDRLPAVLMAGEAFLAGDPFVLQYGDGILRHDLGTLVRTVEEDERLDALLLVHRGPGRADAADRGNGAALLTLTGGFTLKPGLAVAGAQVFGAGFMRRARDHIRRHHSDLDFAALAASLAGCGTRVGVRRVEGWGRFTGETTELLELNRLLLDDLDPATGIRDIEPHDARIVGRVAIHPSARISSSLIRGPAVIGREATITDAFIGPYTAIGDGARVEGTEIEHSIVFSGAEVLFVGARLESSVVGRDARIVRDFSLPQALRLQLGDRASVVLR